VNVWGTILAVGVLSITVAGLQQLGAPFFVEQIFNGTMLVVAVGVSGLRHTPPGRQPPGKHRRRRAPDLRPCRPAIPLQATIELLLQPVTVDVLPVNAASRAAVVLGSLVLDSSGEADLLLHER